MTRTRATFRNSPGWALGVLTVAYVLSFVDRQFLSVAAEPIRLEIGLTDVQLGLLGGLAFAACYTLCSLPISALSDRYHRPLLIASGIVVWSAATAACGLARDFTELLLARMAVGVGEAVLLPAAYAMLGDLYDRERLPTATGILGAGSALGTGAALVVGGAMLDRLAAPDWAPLAAWRLSFLAFGALGVLAAVLVLTVPEPRRRAARPREPVVAVAPFLRANAGALWPMVAAGTLLTTFGYGFSAWMPAFFARTYGWTPTEVGASYGAAVLICGLVAAPAWGRFATAWTRRRGTDPCADILIVVALVLAVLTMVGPLLPTGPMAFACLGLTPLFSGALIALVPAWLVARTPEALRARVIALFLTIANLLGISAGPVLYAWVTTHLLGGESQLRYSIAIVSPLLLGTAALVLWRRRPALAGRGVGALA